MTAQVWGPQSTAAGVPYGKLHQTECKQQFSLAYSHAVASAARCIMENIRSDVECVDYTIRQTADHVMYNSSQVDVQMKCTSQDVLKDDGVHWSLDKSHYDKLRDTKTYNKKILVVLVVPEDILDWMHHSEKRLLLRQCAYWTYLGGAPEVSTATKTVLLPRENVFNVDQLLGILQRVGDGGTP